jgi:hypothetical protein
MKKIIVTLSLIIFSSITIAQTIIRIKKTTWFVNGVKRDGGGNFWGISFATPYVYFYVIKNNQEKGTITYKMDSVAGGIWIGHDLEDENTKINIDTEIPASAVIPTFTVTMKKGNTTAKVILELEK